MDREQGLSVLLNWMQTKVTFSSPISGATKFRFVSRKLRLWQDVTPNQRPACFLVEHGELQSRSARGMPRKADMMVSLFCYTKIGNNDTGAIFNNLMLDAIENALTTDFGTDRCTLNKQVYDCRIEGQVFKDPGDLDGDGLLIVPLRVLLP